MWDLRGRRAPERTNGKQDFSARGGSAAGNTRRGP